MGDLAGTQLASAPMPLGVAGMDVAAAGYGVGMEAVEYTDTFITVAPDTAVPHGIVPAAWPSGPTVASATDELIGPHPYRFRSPAVIFAVWADRQATPQPNGTLPGSRSSASRARAFARATWGNGSGGRIHADEHGRIAGTALWHLGTRRSQQDRHPTAGR